MGVKRRILRMLFGVILIPVLVAYSVQLPHVVHVIFACRASLASFGVGCLAYLVIWAVMLTRTRRVGVWTTFEHELTHAVLCVLLFRRVSEIVASTRASLSGSVGHVRHEADGGWRDTLIALAPYFFPTYAVGLLLLRPIISAEALQFYDVAVGFTFGYHVLSTLKEFSLRQTDITGQGIFFSCVFLLLANMIMIIGILLFVSSGWPALWEYLKAGPLWLADIAMAD